MAHLRLKLNVEEEPVEQFAKFTSSGAFQVGDFFRIDERGYTLTGGETTESSTLCTPSTVVSASASTSTPAAAVAPANATVSILQSPSQIARSSLSPASSSPAARGASVPGLAISTPAGAAAGVSVTSLDDLIVLNPIGQGASGLVQRAALRSNPSIHVALKVVPLDLSETKSKQILIELRTLHYAEHPGIVDFYGAFYRERSLSLVLEYMDRGSLADCLKRVKAQRLKQQKKRYERRTARHSLSNASPHPQSSEVATAATSAAAAVTTAAFAASPPLGPNPLIVSSPLVDEATISCIARQLLSGLHYLHTTLRVLHRDLKPSNILLSSGHTGSERGLAKLADFGVSGELQEQAGNENKISFVGTISYMSPERIQGLPHSFDSDLWSLGLTLLEMTLGYFPYAKPHHPDADPNATAPSSSITERLDESSSEEEPDGDGSESDGDGSKRRPIAARAGSTGGHTTGSDSPSSSAASTPSHAAFSLASPSTVTSGEFALGGNAPQQKQFDLYNATQTHAPGQPIPSPSNNLFRRTSAGVANMTSPHPPTSNPAARPDPAQRARERRTAAKSRFGFWDIMQRIVQSPAPQLPDRISKKTGKPKYSPEFRDFLQLCLKKEPRDRPTAAQLLEHPFITKHADATLEAWLRTVPASHTSAVVPTTAPLLRPLRIGSPSSTHSSSPSSNAINAGAPTASPRHPAALPPLPRRQTSIGDSPRTQFLAPPPSSAVPLPLGGSASHASHTHGPGTIEEEESVIETFPVTPSVPGFANAYESFPIPAEEILPSPPPPAAHATSAPMLDAILASGGLPSNSSLASQSSVRSKRKPAYDLISVDVEDDSNALQVLPPDSVSSVASRHGPTSLTISPSAASAASAPASTRPHPHVLIGRPPMTQSCVASPPSGRTPGSLKRQKSAECAPSDIGASASASASPLAAHSNTAAASFAANMRLIAAQRQEALDHFQQRATSTFGRTHDNGIQPSTSETASNTAAPGPLLSPFTPASAAALAHFNLSQTKRQPSA